MSAPAPSRGRSLTARLVLAGVLLVPVVEIVVIILVARTIGAWWTFLALLLVSVVGAVLVRSQWGTTWRTLQRSLQTGRMPADEIADAALLLCGGVLLLFPGFVTGIVGLLLALPFTRFVGRRLLQWLIARRAWVSVVGSPGVWRSTGPSGPKHSGDDEVIEGEIIDEDDDQR